MKDPDTIPARVGQQLAQRREDLDLTQAELGERIGITSFAVSAAERGRNAIRRSRRPDWERALGLRTGTLTRAYRDGSRIETEEPAPATDTAPTDDPDLTEDPQELMRQARALIARADAILEQRRRA